MKKSLWMVTVGFFVIFNFQTVLFASVLKNIQKPELELSGALYNELRWLHEGGETSTDLYIRKIELSAEIGFTEWLSSTLVVNSEWIGEDSVSSEAEVVVDEATVNIHPAELPFYLIVGKRTQPFGVFETSLVSDPMTQDAYETKQTGITIGFLAPFNTDLSVTLYKAEQMNHLFESGLFEASVQRNQSEDSDDLEAYIVAVVTTPVEDRVSIALSYLSEPGWQKRNETLGFALNVDSVLIENLKINAEYMKALSRERYGDTSSTFKEGVLSLAASYSFTSDSTAQGNSAGSGRTLQLSARYEYFDDDDMHLRLGVWTVKHRYSVGCRYDLYQSNDTGLNAFVAAEHRWTKHRGISETRELFVRLAIEF